MIGGAPRSLVSILVVLTLITADAAGGQVQSTLLERAAAAALRAGEAWRGVVARETYVQKFLPWAGVPPREPSRGRAVVARTLTADLLLVFDAAGPWELHRDVLAVDGREVTDRAERLATLFLSPDAGARERMRRVTQESARFNLGDITRTFNVPTFPLVVVHPQHRDRFRVTVREPAAGTDTAQEVRFEERTSPTLVRSTLGRDVRLRGRLLIDVVTGELLKAVIEPEAEGVAARIEVTYDAHPSLTTRVPVRMWEWYHTAGPLTDPSVQGGRGVYNAYIEALATYSEFRRYEVQLQESVGEVKR